MANTHNTQRYIFIKKKLKSRTLIVFFCFAFLQIHAQNHKKEGDKYYENLDYSNALIHYNQYSKIDRREKYLLKRGICNYYTNKLENAMEDFQKAENLDLDDPDLFLYMGKTLHTAGVYNQAASQYKRYLNEIKDKKLQDEIKHWIKQCGFANLATEKQNNIIVQNIGKPINGEYDEIKPFPSTTNLNKIYFSSNSELASGEKRNKNKKVDKKYGRKLLDIFSTELMQGLWTPPAPLPYFINSGNHDQVQTITPGGEVLIYSQSVDEYLSGGIIKTDTFENKTHKNEILKGPIIGSLGDKDLFLTKNHSIIFSSKRAGGYGGYDLYVVHLINGYWSDVFNLGPNINSPYDEVSPFLTNDGLHLYYSSNRIETWGGFDIFEASYDEKNKNWIPAENLGKPFNSTRDDLYFQITVDGKKIYFCSDRLESFGGFDLFVAYNQNPDTRQLVSLSPKSIFNAKNMVLSKTKINYNTEQSRKIDQSTNNKISDQLSNINISSLLINKENTITADNRKVLNDIIDHMKASPEMNIALISHNSRSETFYYDLYFSALFGDKLLNYFVDRGISPDRLDLIGAGSNYPMVLKKLNGQKVSLADRFNNRIDFIVTQIDNSKSKVVYSEPDIAEYLRLKEFDLFRNDWRGLSYRIEIAITNQLIQNENLADFYDVLIQKQGPYFVYSVGLFKKYADAKKNLQIVISRGYENAVIKPYLYGKEIPAERILLNARIYNDLNNYISK